MPLLPIYIDRIEERARLAQQAGSCRFNVQPHSGDEL
jgi:hypothetical protein